MLPFLLLLSFLQWNVFIYRLQFPERAPIRHQRNPALASSIHFALLSGYVTVSSSPRELNLVKRERINQFYHRS